MARETASEYTAEEETIPVEWLAELGWHGSGYI
jgi:hypothetical protein